MASKDNKTSKTARVMNLLSKKTDSVPPEDSSAENAEQAAASSAPVPPVITSMAPDAAAADQIKSALELAFEEELERLGDAPEKEPEAAQEPVDEPAPVPKPLMEEETPVEEEEAPVEAEIPEEEPVQEPDIPPVAEEPVQEEPIQEEPVQEPPVQQEEAPVEEAPAEAAGAAEHDWQIPESPTSPGYINVMQVLVEEKAPKYIQMFGLCQCSRCLEDVKALTLNHLPPKYVVLEQGDMIPRLTLYEGKYSSDITAQLLHACRVVMDRPHHTR